MKTKTLLWITGLSAIAVIAALYYVRSRPATSAAARLSVPSPSTTPIAEAADYQDGGAEMGPAVDDPSAEDTGVITLQ